MFFFAGPAHVGQSFTYRVTGTMSTQASPKVSTLVLTWTAPTRLYARLSGSSAAVNITRADDGVLSVANASDPGAADVATVLNQLNFPGAVAARLNAGDHTQTTMAITAPGSSAPTSVPVNINLINTDAGATLVADGFGSGRNPESESGYGRRGGGPGGGWSGGGGWRSRGSNPSPNPSSAPPPPTGFVLEAAFDQSGSLEHAIFRETFSSTAKGAQPIEETFTIDRM